MLLVVIVSLTGIPYIYSHQTRLIYANVIVVFTFMQNRGFWPMESSGQLKDFMQMSLICIIWTPLLYIKATSLALYHLSVRQPKEQKWLPSQTTSSWDSQTTKPSPSLWETLGRQLWLRCQLRNSYCSGSVFGFRRQMGTPKNTGNSSKISGAMVTPSGSFLTQQRKKGW